MGALFLADAFIVQRYIEMLGQFTRVVSVVTVRGSEHSKDIQLFDITDEGIIVGETLSEHAGIMSGRSTLSP
ncbi:ATPase domain-containing protein [Undibacterium arcticum]